MTPPPEESAFDVRIVGSGTVNDVDFTASGRGKGDPRTGSLVFEATFSDVPRNTDPFANLLAVLIIETAVFGREIGEAKSLLSLAKGVFEFSQIISGKAIATSSVGKVTATSERAFEWSSRACGHVELRKVSEIRPFVAVMMPAGAGKLTEVIEIPIIDGGDQSTVHAIRTFTFTPAAELLRPQLREISIRPTIRGLTVSVDIKSNIRTFWDSSGVGRKAEQLLENLSLRVP